MCMQIQPTGSHRAATALVAIALLAAARAIDAGLVSPPPCPIRALTGWPCLTCGMTTAFIHVTRFDFPGAFHASPLGALLALTCFAWPPLALFGVRPRDRMVALLPLAVSIATLLSWAFVACTTRPA